MAFMSGIHHRPSTAVIDIVGLLRLDNESNYMANKGRIYDASLEKMLNLKKVVTNTYNVDSSDNQTISFLHNVLVSSNHSIEVTDWYAIAISRNKEVYQSHDFNAKAKIGVQLALNILSRGKVVVTDRLHAYILCLQLGIPHVIVDNSYGKLSAFYNTWAKDCNLTHFASSIESAFEIAKDIAKS